MKYFYLWLKNIMLYHMWENLEAENFDKNLPTNSYYKCSED